MHQRVLTQLVEARRLASELHVEFTRASEAANRAVMADTDEASTAAAEEAKHSREVVERNIEALRPLLQSLGYRDDMRSLDEFTSRYEEYRRLDDEILPLAVENTNLKAQRLSFGPAREAADAFRTSVAGAVESRGAKGSCCAEAIAARARGAVLEIQVMHAPHIAEAEDAAMTRMEGQMKASEAVARKALDGLKTALTPVCGASARRGRSGPGSLHGDPRRDHHAVTSQQQRSFARLVARPKARRHCGMRGSVAGA